MYTAHQIDCLKQMGITFYSPVTHRSSESSLSKTQNTNVVEGSGNQQAIDLPASLIDDLKVLFPSLVVEGPVVKLNEQFKWRFQAGTPRLIVTKTQLLTSTPESLTAKDWRQAWSHIADLVSKQ